MNTNSNMSQMKQSSMFIATMLSALALNFFASTTASADTLNKADVLEGTGLSQQTFSVGRKFAEPSTQAEGLNLDGTNDSAQTDNELLQMLTQKKQQLLISGEDVKAGGVRTREEVILAHKNGQTSSKYAKQKMAGEAAQFANPIFHEFSIYEASSRLFTDNDLDGYYQTFSVTFDADLIGFGSYERADVYAELYLSRDGGPWVHYYSTDIFTIIGDSSDDDFEVLTTLHTGYPADYYDVLIDLYEVGFDDIVATISSDDTDNLYALPLESSDRDEVYIGDSSSEGHGGGSLSLLGLFILGCVSLKRRFF
ncbi:choice-of-anchor H family protein [Shewanella atlantica]|uniref:GlyGly-CTERM sorting domain-containing protein n=1 Tax=Shewanella atlantica TaxID=271099 RepID=A0A431WB50_9GAMM|nr:choice-of-anchor H family protein [Shewanella atlantica]RTR32734.1 hypothetical protein EKG39_10190 [Shewanella atlantica]